MAINVMVSRDDADYVVGTMDDRIQDLQSRLGNCNLHDFVQLEEIQAELIKCQRIIDAFNGAQG